MIAMRTGSLIGRSLTGQGRRVRRGWKMPRRSVAGRRGCRLHDAGAIEHDDAIGAAGEVEAVRDQDGGAALHDGLVAGDDLALGDRIERRGRLVEDQHRRVGQEGARDGDALALAGRERRAALARPASRTPAAGRR